MSKHPSVNCNQPRALAYHTHTTMTAVVAHDEQPSVVFENVISSARGNGDSTRPYLRPTLIAPNLLIKYDHVETTTLVLPIYKTVARCVAHVLYVTTERGTGCMRTVFHAQNEIREYPVGTELILVAPMKQRGSKTSGVFIARHQEATEITTLTNVGITNVAITEKMATIMAVHTHIGNLPEYFGKPVCGKVVQMRIQQILCDKIPWAVNGLYVAMKHRYMTHGIHRGTPL